MNAAKSFLAIVLLVSAGLAFALRAEAADASGTDRSDSIAVLIEKLQSGRETLDFDSKGFGFLKSLLARLHVPESSQILVFSKTSLQHKYIGPQTPRAIYFNDKVAIGSVQGSPVLEIIAPTREHGYAFYTLENNSPGSPHFVRHEGATCGRCHGADSIEPGLIVASTLVGADGNAALIFSDGPARLFNFTDQTTPISERWSGWYVTGTHGDQHHQGNGAFIYGDDGVERVQNENAQNVLSLETFFDVSHYLVPSSDIVALMVFEHQARMTNSLLSIGALARRSRELPRAALDDLVAYMLFTDEAPLTAAIEGNSGFAAAFTGEGPRDSQGRSLRDFDLRRRLFKYPLSFMIYSPTFAALPASARTAIYDRLVEILSGADSSPRFAHLTADDRRNILGILHETFPASALN